MHVLVAPGAFRGTTSAVLAARALATGWSRRAPATITTLALSDGASGLVDVVSEARGGTLMGATVPGPLGDPVPASVLLLDGPGGGTAVVEAGQVLGAHLVPPERASEAVLHGSSAGVGHLVRVALASGAGRIVVGLGAGVVHDGGLGLLEGLAGESLAGRGSAPRAPVRLDEHGLDALGDVRATLAGRDLVLACADGAPLLGLHGAGAALSARLGVDPAAAQALERAVGHASDVIERWASAQAGMTTGRRGRLPLAGAPAQAPRRLARTPRSGAGGGAAFALAALGGRLLDGASAVAGLLDLAGAVAEADLVLTGGAELDADALHAGVVATVGAEALRHGVVVVAVAPRVELSRRELAQIGVVGAYALDPTPGPFAGEWTPPRGEVDRLADLAARLAGTWAPRGG